MTRSVLLVSLVLSVCAYSAACVSREAPPDATNGHGPEDAHGRRVTTNPQTGELLPDFNDPYVKEKEGLPDPLEGLARGQQQNDALCARAGSMNDTKNPGLNAVTNALCKERRSITSLRELQLALGLDFKKTDAGGRPGSSGNPAFALLGHSSSLVARSVSSINPRAIVFTPSEGPARSTGFTAMAFTRGEPFVEIAAEQASPASGTPSRIGFYLVKLDLACEASHSCTNADLLTPAIESNWKGFTVYDDEDLKNTIVDCRHCHQPGGLGTAKMLRMQELEEPWTHWFRDDGPGGKALLEDYVRAHGEQEDYGGIPGPLIRGSDPGALEDLVKGQGFREQPNEFDTRKIEDEVRRSSAPQPESNTPPGQSRTWDVLYARAMAGQFIPVPYHDVKVTDPAKLQLATNEYRRYMSGATGELLDIRRVFLDSALEAMTFLPRRGASGREVLVQSCAQCHNGKLDPSISRARFDVTKLDAMSRAEKDLAIARLTLGAANRLKMPPPMMRWLPDDALEAAIRELSQ